MTITQSVHMLRFFLFIVLFLCATNQAWGARIYGSDAVEEIRPLRFRELSGAIDLRYRYEDHQQEQVLAEKQSRFEERLDLRTQGSVYHPNFLNIDLDGSFGLGQEQFRGDFEDDQNFTVHEYRANLNFLRQKPYTFSLFADRSANTISRQFFTPMKMDSESYGGAFNYQHKRFPMTLQLMDQHTSEDASDFRRDRREQTADFRVTNNHDDHIINEFSYLYKYSIEESATLQRLGSHNLNLQTRIDYDLARGNSSISYLTNSGLIDSSQLQVNQNLTLDHARRISSLYNLNFARFTSGNFSSDIAATSVGARHKLYESLITEVKGEAGRTEGTDFRESYYGPTASMLYTKKVPGGVFSGGYNFLYRRTDREAGAGFIKVFGEMITLTDGRQTFLANPQVISGSVVVRDVFGAVMAAEVDYRLVARGLLTEIQRLALPNNSVVFVDYDVTSSRLLAYNTMSNGVTLRYDFRQLFSLYYNFLNIDRSDVSDTPLAITQSALYDTKRSLYGADFRWRGFNLVAEYEDDASDLMPLNGWRLTGNYSIILGDYALCGLGASMSRTRYLLDENEVTLKNLNATLRIRPSSSLEIALEAGYLTQQGKNLDTDALRVRGDLISRFRAVELKLGVEYLKRRDLAQEREDLTIDFKLVRYFNVL